MALPSYRADDHTYAQVCHGTNSTVELASMGSVDLRVNARILYSSHIAVLLRLTLSRNKTNIAHDTIGCVPGRVRVLVTAFDVHETKTLAQRRVLATANWFPSYSGRIPGTRQLGRATAG